MKRFFVLLCALTAFPIAAWCQSATVVTVERWTIVQYGQVANEVALREEAITRKVLPPGYLDFTPVSDETASQLYDSRTLIACVNMEKAISFGKRLDLGMDPEAAMHEVNRLNHEVVCGYGDGRVLKPAEYAVRGADGDRRIFLMKMFDAQGGDYYIGLPFHG